MTADTPRRPTFAPADRPHRSRRAVRVILADDAGRILLFEDSDPGLHPPARWWMTPGGGIDAGETLHEAAVRELQEETGLTVSEGQLTGPVAIRTVRHGFSDQIVDQQEWFFLVCVPHFAVDIAGHTEDEKETVLGHRWWTAEALRSVTDIVWPADVLAVWALGSQPTAWPVDLGTVEESSVPIQLPPAR